MNDLSAVRHGAPGEAPFDRRWAAGERINRRWLADETRCVRDLLAACVQDVDTSLAIAERAASLVDGTRASSRGLGGLDAFLQEYDLSSEEGVVLMCLAEALLRIPDSQTADRLISDKLASGKWEEHLGASRSLFVNASTWGLMLTGRLVRPDTAANPMGLLQSLSRRAGEPAVRTALRQAMRIMGHQFVMGRDIDEALRRSSKGDNRGYRYSFDMLGEAALTADDAERYQRVYAAAIRAVGAARGRDQDPIAAPSVSVKLSALYPRYEFADRAGAVTALAVRLGELCALARTGGIALTIDAEESERLELSLEIFERVYRDPAQRGWGGLGLVIQAYQKRAPDVLDWLIGLADEVGERICVRLVKGAYWDSEVKRAQEQGLPGYPVYTRKCNTDVAYLACARKLLQAPALIYPQFATHNAHTVATVMTWAGERPFEFQRLHGMGEALYAQVIAGVPPRPCRVYAPVGRHKDLLPYLVRRLLENGANTSFVNRIADERLPVSEIVSDPVAAVQGLDVIPHPRIPQPRDLYGPQRPNAAGWNLADAEAIAILQGAFTAESAAVVPVVGGKPRAGNAVASNNPAALSEIVGSAEFAAPALANEAVDVAVATFARWDTTPVSERVACLRRAADLFEAESPGLIALCVREAGKTLRDAVAELREAVDFLRYYAAQAERTLAEPEVLPGPTGEHNALSLAGRGVFVCISPWNFPLAIFTGQVSAALAAGNTVIAKPAEQTPLIAGRAVALLHQAGIPGGALQLLPGAGDVGAALVADPRIAGVAFTGSTETAQVINRTLAARSGALATLIAETGGLNAMVVDSSALPEQVVVDVAQSAFGSAGQRCSALRVLLLQDEIAERVLELLRGYMATLVIGDPRELRTDIGPVIDAEARAALEAHIEQFAARGRLLYRCDLPSACANGTFVAPAVIALDDIGELEREMFGPILHIVRYRAGQLDAVIDAVNTTGYGLTLGIHSRVDATARRIAERVRVGNVYINRNQVGAVVGVQPFGGQGLSGTGPKAGGPHYLSRFVTEKVITTNTAAVGGNASLLALD